MNGYLVLLRHCMDDIPVGLYANEKDAEEAAMRHGWDATHEEQGVLELDCDTPCNISIVRFMGGRPVKLRIVRHYKDE